MHKTYFNFKLLLLVILFFGGCGEEGEVRTQFRVKVIGKGAGQSLKNDHGYTVQLTLARLHLGPLYFFSGDPLFTRRDEAWPHRLLRGLRPVGEALAHPGHYQEGEALAQVLGAATVDLLSGTEASLGLAEGVTGAYRSAQVNLAPASDNGGHTAQIQGTATSASHTVAFQAMLDITQKVQGIAFLHEMDTRSGRVRVEVDLSRWVESVDFSQLKGTGTVTVAAGSQAENALTRGLFNTSAFMFAWIPD